VAGAPGINFTGAYKTATSFPVPILMASAFDDDLIYDIGTVIGTEARAFGNGGVAPVDYWTPNVNPLRDPRWGRASETAGEDAVRIKGYTKSLIAGLEGNNAKERRILATCKHYAANDLEAWGGVTRHDFDAKISQQDLAEYYLQPFQQCARDSKVGSIMCSYNAVNGVPACANPYLMGTILREHWKWDLPGQYITSDCEAVADISENHHYAATLAEGTGLAFNAGMDTSCEYSGSSDIPGAWTGGYLNETTVDRALNRLYNGLIRTGYFNGAAAAYAGLSPADINTPGAQQLARSSAAAGMVLLKNDETLPLSLTNGSKVAMIGFWANDTSKLQGGYSGPAPFLHSPVWAGQQFGLSINFAPGPILQSNNASDNWSAQALEAASASEYILYFGGQDTTAAAEGRDRLSLSWPEAQITLLNKLSALGKPLVVLQMGEMLDATPILSNAGINSHIWASWPGQDGGPAALDVITGAKPIAGRLPATQYPANYTQVPMTDMNLRPGTSNGTYNPGRTYRWFPSPVQAFGFGLHYTTFAPSFGSWASSLSIQNLLGNCTNEFPDTCALPSLPIKVTNTGNRTSDFVALAFVKSESGPKPYPLKTLASYTRVHDVKAGSTAEAELSWTVGNLARIDESGNTVIYPGDYQVWLDEPVKAMLNFTLTGTEVMLDKWPGPPS
jgi:beta-D-xylosidase 4